MSEEVSDHVIEARAGHREFAWTATGKNGDGYRVLLPIKARLVSRDRPFDVEFEVDTDDRNSLVVTSVCVNRRHGGRPVSASAVRNLDLAEWQRQAVKQCSTVVPRLVFLGGKSDGTSSASLDLDPYTPWRRSPADPFVRMNDTTLKEVADVYRTAMEHGSDPTNTVADIFRKPRSTAGRWVLEARRRGFLEPPCHGVAPAGQPK